LYIRIVAQDLHVWALTVAWQHDGRDVCRRRTSPSDPVAPEAVLQVWRRHTNLKFGMAAPFQSAEIWAVDFQENHKNCCRQMSDLKAKVH